MFEVVFNEKTEIENLILGGRIKTNKFGSIINKLARYNVFCNNMAENENISVITQWMKQNCVSFNERIYLDVIKSTVMGAKKYPLRTSENLIIYQSEIDKILSVDNIRKEKVLFTMLCVAKYQKNWYGYKNGKFVCTIQDIFKMARVHVSVQERENMMHELYGLIGAPFRVDGQERYVTFLSNGEDDVQVLELCEADCAEPAYVYLNFKNDGGYKHCNKCGSLFKIKSNNHIYCKACSTYSPISEKVAYCVDCGTETYVDSKDNKTCRCLECKGEHVLKTNRDRQKRWYDSKNAQT